MGWTTLGIIFALFVVTYLDPTLGLVNSQISFYSDRNFQNSLSTYGRPDNCVDLDPSFVDQIQSVSTVDGCFELFDRKNCKGRHIRIEKDRSVVLADRDFENQATSMRLCKTKNKGSNGRHHGSRHRGHSENNIRQKGHGSHRYEDDNQYDDDDDRRHNSYGHGGDNHGGYGQRGHGYEEDSDRDQDSDEDGGQRGQWSYGGGRRKGHSGHHDYVYFK